MPFSIKLTIVSSIFIILIHSIFYHVDATFSTATYPSVTPKPKSIKRHFKTISRVKPANININIAEGCHISVTSVVTSGAKRVFDSMTNNIKVGETLPYLKVKLPPLVNTTNPALKFLSNVNDNTPFFNTLNIVIKNTDGTVRADTLGSMEEDYTLNLDTESGTLEALTWVGALRGLETLSQLIVYTGEGFLLPNLPIEIEDAPRFKWRGVLLDTARHYFDIESIEKVIETMAFVKLNVLHWHIVDSQSFPYDSHIFPDLAKYGSYSYPKLIYTQDQIKNLIQYSLERGIRLVPEFDLPGHAASWGFSKSMENVITHCFDYVEGNSGGVMERAINVISMDVTQENIDQIVTKLLSEVLDLFQDPYIHLGGDEVMPKCWNSIPRIVKFAKEHKEIGSVSKLQAWFTKKILNYVVNEKKRLPILWEEAYDAGSLDEHKEAVVNLWKSFDDLENATRDGHDIIVSFGAYMDRQSPLGPVFKDKKTGHWMYQSTWTDMYDDIYNMNFGNNVIGGEISSWDENADFLNIETRIFQRGNAVAERLWSIGDSSAFDINNARIRLAEFRCKTVRRGSLYIGPMMPDYCDTYNFASDKNNGNNCPSDIPSHGNNILLISLVVIFGLSTLFLSFFIFCSNGGKQQTPASLFLDTSNNIQGGDGSRDSSYRQIVDDDGIDGDIL